MSISKLAHIDPQAKIGSNVTIDPFAYVAGDVEIGEGTWIGPNAVVQDGARIGSGCRIFPSAVISGVPQDLKFKGEYSLAIVGANTTVRECATINRGTASREKTVVGESCLIMAYSHVAHDCVLKDHIILGNACQLAGEVEIDEYAILSGACLVHQFTRIGAHVMIQGGSRVTKDVPPFVLAGRDPITYTGLNLVGLRRRGFKAEILQEIQEAYRILYRSGMNVTQAVDKILDVVTPCAEIDYLIRFAQRSERGLIRGSKDSD